MGETWRGNDDFRPAAVFLVRLAATASEQGRGGGATDARAKRREARNLPEAGSRGVLWADGAPGAGLAARPQQCRPRRHKGGRSPPTAGEVGRRTSDSRGGRGAWLAACAGGCGRGQQKPVERPPPCAAAVAVGSFLARRWPWPGRCWGGGEIGARGAGCGRWSVPQIMKTGVGLSADSKSVDRVLTNSGLKSAIMRQNCPSPENGENL